MLKTHTIYYKRKLYIWVCHFHHSLIRLLIIINVILENDKEDVAFTRPSSDIFSELKGTNYLTLIIYVRI